MATSPAPADRPGAEGQAGEGAQVSGVTGRVLFAVLAVIVFIIDRVTKGIVAGSLQLGTEVQVLPFLWIAHTRNTGAAFSIGPNLTSLFLVASAAISIGLIVYAVVTRLDAFTGIVLGLILGGALGNGYDRLFHGGATDFIDVHFWPIFNIADSAVSIGVVLLIVGYLLRHRNDSSG